MQYSGTSYRQSGLKITENRFILGEDFRLRSLGLHEGSLYSAFYGGYLPKP